MHVFLSTRFIEINILLGKVFSDKIVDKEKWLNKVLDLTSRINQSNAAKGVPRCNLELKGGRNHDNDHEFLCSP